MLHRTRERNIPGGAVFLIGYCSKGPRGAARGGQSLQCFSDYQPTLDRRVHAGVGNTLPRMPCSPHLHPEQQCPSRGPCFHDQHPRWQPPRAIIWPQGAQSKVWGSLGAVPGGSGRLVWVIFCLGFFVSSSSSVSLSQTCTTTLGVDSVPA